MRKHIVFLAACAALTGCESVGNWADDVGSYLPVLSDQRCEHWQCFTDGGKQQSDMNRMMREERSRQEEQGEQGGQQQPQQYQQQQQQPPQPPAPPPGDAETNPYDYYRP